MKLDAAIIGAGPAGAVTALVLSQRGRNVALVDRIMGHSTHATRKVGESLPGAARPLLQHLGLLSLVEDGPHLPSYGNSFAWGTEELETTDFIRDPNGLGWHLDRARFDEDLRQAAGRAGAVLSKANRVEVERAGEYWRIGADREPLDAKWIVDATGRNSGIARELGATRLQDDTLMAAYAWAEVDGEPATADTRTLIESTPDGWWYTSVLPDHTSVVALHTNAQTLRPMMKEKGIESWVAALKRTHHVGRRLQKARFITDLKCTQAGGARLDRFVGEGWLATGDAALSFDPLSSQGIFNAIYTGMKAAQAIDAALSGDARAMDAYVDRLEAIRNAYLANRRHVYSTEQRWSQASFWKQRVV